MWGSYPPIVTADSCVKVDRNFLTRALAEASRPATSLDCDMKTVLLKFSIASPAIFGVRVQFVLGALEANGTSPAWLSPANRRSERVLKTERPVVRKRSRVFRQGDREKLVAKLNETGGGISQVEAMPMEALKHLHRDVFGDTGR